MKEITVRGPSLMLFKRIRNSLKYADLPVKSSEPGWCLFVLRHFNAVSVEAYLKFKVCQMECNCCFRPIYDLDISNCLSETLLRSHPCSVIPLQFSFDPISLRFRSSLHSKHVPYFCPHVCLQLFPRTVNCLAQNVRTMLCY